MSDILNPETWTPGHLDTNSRMKAAFLYDDKLQGYDFGEGHPFRGNRFKVFFNFFEERFAPLQERIERIKPDPAGDEALELVHTREYIDAIRAASAGIVPAGISRYVSADNVNPYTGDIPEGIEEAARLIVGGSLLAGELIAEGRFSRAVGIGGGLHHAKPDYGEGFCFYNDVAICVKNLKRKYNFRKILVLDTDAHAGNGTKEIFYDDPHVLFIDLHQDPRTIYPGTGFVSEIGSGRGEGFTINLPLLPGAAYDSYRYLFEEIIFPLAGEFQPEAVIRYGGSDPHYLDQLTNLGLTVEGFRKIGRYVQELAAEFCAGRNIDLLVSGYTLEVLPFAWSALISGLLDFEVDLSGLEEKDVPPPERRLPDTRAMAGELRNLLKRYWKCMHK